MSSAIELMSLVKTCNILIKEEIQKFSMKF